MLEVCFARWEAVNVTSAFEFDPVNKVVCWRLRGEVADELFAESLQLVADILADTNPKSGIIDLSLVTALRISTETIKQTASSKPLFPAELPRVVVAPLDHVYGIARMFAAFSQDTRRDVAVVRTMDEAYKFLSIKDPQFRAMGLKRKTGS
jgi:hypothetical protein